ncbi:Mitogen-activated protein kinase kinase 8 [Cardamine amara subsp. amara]|uniref:Mitogen-activated protein kinase kinase 8 n=1 Tax=Cardamine amara subsp. amara TaxID=228776 RepID=A0ABD1C644_CARAN
MILVRDPGFFNLKLSPTQASTTTLPCRFPIAAAKTASATVTSHARNTVFAIDLDKINVVDSGNVGTVFKNRDKTNSSEIYVLKKVKKYMDSAFHCQLLGEIEIFRLFNSPYIIKCHEIFQNP